MGCLPKPIKSFIIGRRKPKVFTTFDKRFYLTVRSKGVGFVSEQQNMASQTTNNEPNRKASKQINFRVSEQEYSKLEQSAETLNISVPAFVKKKAQGARIVAPKIKAEDSQEIARQLAKIGGNLNQLAKHANQGGTVDKQSLQALKNEVAQVWQQLT